MCGYRAIACVTLAVLCAASVLDSSAAVGVGARTRTRARRQRSWDDTDPKPSTSTNQGSDKGSEKGSEKVDVRAGTLLKPKHHGSGGGALLPCGGSAGPCRTSGTPDIVVDPSKGPKEGVNYTAPLVDADATRDDHLIYSELVRYRRTVDAIEARRDDRVQQDVTQMLSAARNELYQRDALGAQMEKEKLKVQQQIHALDMLQQEYNKHGSAAGRMVAAAASTLRKFSTADDPPDTTLLTDLTSQVRTVQQHQHADTAPSVSALESAIARLAKHKQRPGSSADADGADDDADGSDKSDDSDSDTGTPEIVDEVTTRSPSDADGDDDADGSK